MQLLKICQMACVGAFFTISLLGSTAHADNLDTYRNLLMNNTYTIKYTEITPSTRMRQHNKDKVSLYTENSMERIVDKEILLYKTNDNVVVCDGDKRYEETGYGDFKACRLQQGEEEFNFTKINEDGKNIYFGNKKDSVVATKINMKNTLIAGNSYGNANMTRLLEAILPPAAKSEYMPVYYIVGSGWLDNGLNYIDYRCDNQGFTEFIRYYFKEYTLIKIASARYYTEATGQLDGQRCIIKINEFSPTPDQQYLKLPEGVKDETKRKKGAE